MIALLVIGGVLLVGAAVLAFLGRRAARRVGAVAGTQRSSCGELRGVAGVSQGALVELGGAAASGPDGELRSPLAERACVWYRSTITEVYRTYETRGSGSNRRRELVEKKRERSDETSSQRFALDDGSGTATIDPRDAHVDRPIEVLDRMVTDDTGGWSRRFNLSIDFGIFNLGGGEGTIGFEQEEWILPAGQQLYVLGEARAEGDGAVVAEPKDGGELLISTRSEDEVLKSSKRRVFAFNAGAASCGVAGLALVVIAFVV